MSDFKEGDLLEHRASGVRCVFVRYRRGRCHNQEHKNIFGCGFNPHECVRDYDKSVSVVRHDLISEEIYSNTFELKKVKEESND